CWIEVAVGRLEFFKPPRPPALSVGSDRTALRASGVWLVRASGAKARLRSDSSRRLLSPSRRQSPHPQSRRLAGPTSEATSRGSWTSRRLRALWGAGCFVAWFGFLSRLGPRPCQPAPIGWPCGLPASGLYGRAARKLTRCARSNNSRRLLSPSRRQPPHPQSRRLADRKSTRLNSSHVKSSDADVCLKKKN